MFVIIIFFGGLQDASDSDCGNDEICEDADPVRFRSDK